MDAPLHQQVCEDRLHVLDGSLDALATLGSSLLLAKDAGRLKMLSPSSLRNDAFLLYALCETSQERLEALTFVNPQFQAN